MRTLSRENGYIKPILSILVLVFLVYAGIQFGMPYYRHSVFKSDAEQLARVSLGRVDKLKNSLAERAEELKIPLAYDEIYVERGAGNTMRVSAMWHEKVNILGLYEKNIEFTVNLTE